MDDESEAVEDGINDQADAQIKALQKTADEGSRRPTETIEGNEGYARREADLIRDQSGKGDRRNCDVTDDKLKIQCRPTVTAARKLWTAWRKAPTKRTKILQTEAQGSARCWRRLATQETIASIKEAAALVAVKSGRSWRSASSRPMCSGTIKMSLAV